MSGNHNSAPSRVTYALAALLVIGAGLAWRSPIIPLSSFVKKYGGDAWWSLLVFLIIRFIHPRSRVAASAIIAFGISLLVEFSQLYHAPWFDDIRGMRLGALVLGSTFNWPDIPAYAVGIILGALVDRRFTGRTDKEA